MTLSTFIPLLSLGTLGIVAIWALLGKRATERRKTDPDAPNSTLAADAPNSTR